MVNYDSNTKTALILILLITSMSMLSFAAVPIYNLFCKATGFGGTVQENSLGSSTKGNRELLIRFDYNVDKDLPWQFIPKQNEVRIKTGENNLVFYYAKNLTNRDIIGTAIYNVTPNKAGKYFVKIYCFCYEEQILKAGQEVLMPVSFYIDPEIEQDPYMDDVRTITLSYSFFKVREAQ